VARVTTSAPRKPRQSRSSSSRLSKKSQHDQKPQRPASHHHQQHEEQLDKHEEKRLLLQCLLLEAGILFHSVFIGLALSVTTGTSFIVLLIAIGFHRKFCCLYFFPPLFYSSRGCLFSCHLFPCALSPLFLHLNVLLLPPPPPLFTLFLLFLSFSLCPFPFF
jgi:hypothetical protein